MNANATKMCARKFIESQTEAECKTAYAATFADIELQRRRQPMENEKELSSFREACGQLCAWLQLFNGITAMASVCAVKG